MMFVGRSESRQYRGWIGRVSSSKGDVTGLAKSAARGRWSILTLRALSPERSMRASCWTKLVRWSGSESAHACGTEFRRKSPKRSGKPSREFVAANQKRKSAFVFLFPGVMRHHRPARYELPCEGQIEGFDFSLLSIHLRPTASRRYSVGLIQWNRQSHQPQGLSPRRTCVLRLDQRATTISTRLSCSLR